MAFLPLLTTPVNEVFYVYMCVNCELGECDMVVSVIQRCFVRNCVTIWQ